MSSLLYLKNGTIVNEGRVFKADILIEGDKISDVIENSTASFENRNIKTLDLEGLYVFPGIIDSHVHFRQPGMTHKADIYSESKAAIAGGVTSIMDMPNTKPPVTSIAKLEDKIRIAEHDCMCNYSFYLGATDNNIDELTSADPSYVCGIKVFMGASTGNMVVKNNESLNDIFRKVKKLIAVHCEDEDIINQNIASAKEKYGVNIPFKMHPSIRSRKACYKSTLKAIDLAQNHDTRLHILHLSTKEETGLLNNIPCSQGKQITGEACVHHLWFTEKDYNTKGALIKWNPAIKTINDRNALRDGINSDLIDIISTDHAPHTFEEKQRPYLECPSGAPMIQHSLPVMLELYHRGLIELTKIAQKMCHNPATRFNITKRGFIRKGFYADLAVVNINSAVEITKNNILYKCGWSPLENHVLKSEVIHTIVNGHQVFNNGIFTDKRVGVGLNFSQ